MKISKRDLQLLLLLGLVVIGALYYWLMYLPMQEKIQALTNEQTVLEQQVFEINGKFTVEKKLTKDLEAAKAYLLKAGERYYGNLYQEHLLLTIKELTEGTSLIMKGITFTEADAPLQELMEAFKNSVKDQTGAEVTESPAAEANIQTPSKETPSTTTVEQTPVATSQVPVAETHVNTIVAMLQYEGYYTDLETFMYNLYKYPKQMVIQSLNITSDTEGYLTGVMAIEFHGMPTIGDDNESLMAFFEKISRRASVTEVFKPYATFVLPDAGDATLPGMEDSLENPEDGDLPAELIPYEPPNELVSSFEDFDYFFTGDHISTVGSASRTVVRTGGNYGLKVQYNFVEPRKSNVANVVFDQKPLLVEKEGIALALNAYSERAIKHRIGAELVDATGKSYEVTFAMGLEATGWQTLQSPLPEGINYPFVVKRILFEGTGLSQQLVAEVILDELKLMLPNLGGSQ